MPPKIRPKAIWPERVFGIEVVARKKQRDEREQGDQGKCGVVAAEETPRRAGIAPVDQFEKTGDDDLFVARFESVQHQPFGELVEREHNQRERGDAAIRFLKNGFWRRP